MYIVVVGLVLDVLRSLGAEIDEHFEEQRGPQPDDEEAGRDRRRGRGNHRRGKA